MPSATFDGAALIVQLPTTGAFDVRRDLYSAWMFWALGNAQFPPAFDVEGGRDLPGGLVSTRNFILRNDLGWVLRMPDANGDVDLVGNLYPADTGAPLTVAAAGFTAFYRNTLSQNVVEIDGSGGSVDQAGVQAALDAQGYTPALATQLAAGPDASAIADAVWNEPL